MVSRIRIRVAQGNDVPLRLKLRTVNNGVYVDLPCVEIENLKIYYGRSTFEKAVKEGNELPYTFDGNTIHTRLESSQIWKLALYNVWIVGVFEGNDVSYNFEGLIEVVEWSARTNIEDFVKEDEVDAGYAIFYPNGYTREEIEEKAKEWEEKINQVSLLKPIGLDYINNLS